MAVIRLEKSKNPYWNDLQRIVQGVSLNNMVVQKYIDEHIKNVRLEVKEVSEQFNDVFQQLSARNFTASAKEEGDMSDLVEKLHNIENRLSVAENEIKHISLAVSRVEQSVENVNQKADRLMEKIDSKFDKLDGRLGTFVTKEEFARRTEGNRFTITTWIALAAVVAAIVVPFLTK